MEAWGDRESENSFPPAAGYAHPDAAVRSLDQSAVLPVAIMCIIVAPDDVKVNVCSAHFTTRVAVVPVSG